MKLDRNINPDGKGKYALINLRKNIVEWGGGDGQFFVIKYKDIFAAPALKAYANAVFKAVLEKRRIADRYRKRNKTSEMAKTFDLAADELEEYGNEIMNEYRAALAIKTKHTPD